MVAPLFHDLSVLQARNDDAIDLHPLSRGLSALE